MYAPTPPVASRYGFSSDAVWVRTLLFWSASFVFLSCLSGAALAAFKCGELAYLENELTSEPDQSWWSSLFEPLRELGRANQGITEVKSNAWITLFKTDLANLAGQTQLAPFIAVGSAIATYVKFKVAASDPALAASLAGNMPGLNFSPNVQYSPMGSSVAVALPPRHLPPHQSLYQHPQAHLGYQPHGHMAHWVA